MSKTVIAKKELRTVVGGTGYDPRNIILQTVSPDKIVSLGGLSSMLAQISYSFGAGFFVILFLVIIFLLRKEGSKSSTAQNTEGDVWFEESLPVMTPLKTVLTEGFHAVLMFLFVIPFYLYGGNVLYGQRLLSNPDDTMAFIIRVAITVLVAELFCNWIPQLGIRLIWWKQRMLFTLLAGLVFASLTYFVIPQPAHEGEAFIGMGIIWVFSEVILYLLYRIFVWDRMR